MIIDLQLLTIKIEGTYGTDANPTGAANAILAQNVKITPFEATEVTRQHARPHMGARPALLVGKTAKITFEVELKGSGTAGTPPAYGVALRCCKCAEVVVAATSVTYSSVSTGHQSGSIYLDIDGILYKILGARGTWKIKLNAMGIAVIEFTMTGLFTQPSSRAVPAPTYGTQLTQDPMPASSVNTPVFTVGGYSAILRSFTFDAGNMVKYRGLIRSESVIITGSDEKADFQIEAVPLATFNPYQLAEDGTTQAIVLTQGVGAGKAVTLNIPNFQFLAPGLTDVDSVVENTIRGKCLPGSAANSQFTLVA